MLGPVFRAYQPAPGRLVAVKQFRLGINPDESQRFAASLDRIVAADLSHAGIAAPIAAGLADTTPYLALDFVAAESFDVVMRESGPANPKEVVSFTRQLAAALDAAAAVGVVHGALHPRDVLMAHDEVRMTGLGIAQALESVGTAAPIRRPYAAPERQAGASWDRRADIYSLGALSYEMLTGRRVLASGSESAQNLPAVEGADLDRLRVVFAKALAEKAAARFETAREFADALERALTPLARNKSNGRKRRGAETQTPDLELPLDIDLETPPLGDSTGPHVEISAIDAALPSSADDPNVADLALHQSRPAAPDLSTLDTRLDEFEATETPELELHAIEQAQADAPSSRAAQGGTELALDALDAATERMAPARDALADDRSVDTASISLTVPPLSDDADAGLPLAAIEQALGAEATAAESAAVDVDNERGREKVRAQESGALANVAALDAALDLQLSEAAEERDLAGISIEPSAPSLASIDRTLAHAEHTPHVPEVEHSADAPGAHDETPAAEPAPSPEDRAADEHRLAPPVQPPAAAPTSTVAGEDLDDDEEDEGLAPWDDEQAHKPREESARWHEDSPGLAVDAALDAITARSAADTTADVDTPLARTDARSDESTDDSEPVPAFARSLTLGQESNASSGNRPILLGVVLGLLVGFAFGYGVGQWRTGNSAQTTTASSTETPATSGGQASSARESARVTEPSVEPSASTPSSTTQGQTASGAASGAAAPSATAPSTAAPSTSPTAARSGAATPPAARQPGRSEQTGAASARQNDAGKLVVRTTPSGANVTIDGKDAGLTPVTATLQPGFHTVRLSHQGYVTAQRRVRITSQPAQPIDLELVARPAREVAATPAAPERASGALVLDSRPSGARVYVDGALVGTTPMQIDAITGGDHAVRFEMDGFGPWSTTAKVAAGGKTRVSGSLER